MSKYYAEIRGLELNAEEILKYCSEWPRSFLRSLWEAIVLEGSKKRENIGPMHYAHMIASAGGQDCTAGPLSTEKHRNGSC